MFETKSAAQKHQSLCCQYCYCRSHVCQLRDSLPHCNNVRREGVPAQYCPRDSLGRAEWIQLLGLFSWIRHGTFHLYTRQRRYDLHPTTLLFQPCLGFKMHPRRQLKITHWQVRSRKIKEGQGRFHLYLDGEGDLPEPRS